MRAGLIRRTSWCARPSITSSASGIRAGLAKVWPHMLRHSCGHALADKDVDFRMLQDYLGHQAV
jgi:integrase